MRQLVFGTSLTQKTSEDRDLNLCQISGDNAAYNLQYGSSGAKV